MARGQGSQVHRVLCSISARANVNSMEIGKISYCKCWIVEFSDILVVLRVIVFVYQQTLSKTLPLIALKILLV